VHVGRVVRTLGERGALLTGLVCAVLAFLIYAFATRPLQFYVGIPCGALSALILPALQSLMSRRVPASQQGNLQGINSAFMGIAAILGPLVYLSTLAFAVRVDARMHLPGLPILIAAAFCATAFVLAAHLARPVADVD